KGLISNCISVLTGAAMRKDIELKSDLPPDVFIFADERLLTQAVTNLINNAIKFTTEGKKIYVNVNTFKEGMSEIVVRDEGVGISEENQDKLFRIDKKFSLEGTNGEKGSGLGLALVKEIIEKHGGDIWFYSKLGEGSEFHITVPEAKNVVVLVEDDVTLRQLYRKMISNLISNFKIIEAENGYEAMSIILNQSPSLVITDHDMPLMNGIQLVEAMRKKDSNRNVPVIVISAKLSDEIIKRYRELNVDKIITKPFKQAELIKCIKESVV
ncbi:MAG: hybrid sensor histidine kinase/response regulator, partial [Melioribacteraceae bacterium]